MRMCETSKQRRPDAQRVVLEVGAAEPRRGVLTLMIRKFVPKPMAAIVHPIHPTMGSMLAREHKRGRGHWEKWRKHPKHVFDFIGLDPIESSPHKKLCLPCKLLPKIAPRASFLARQDHNPKPKKKRVQNAIYSLDLALMELKSNKLAC